MTDDIVTRLIDEKVHQYEIKDFELGQLLKDAQDEIEQLRKDMQFQARVISRHYDQFRELHKEIERLRQNPNTFISDNWLAELLNGCISHFSFDVSSRTVDISFNLSPEQAQTLWEAVQAGKQQQ